jgi:hypothetical protein
MGQRWDRAVTKGQIVSVRGCVHGSHCCWLSRRRSYPATLQRIVFSVLKSLLNGRLGP